MYSKRGGGDAIANAYSGQDGAGSLPYFVGRQYGAGWLRSLARIAFPILKRVVGVAGNIASNTAQEMIDNRSGKSFTQSLKDNALSEAGRLLKGHGRRRKRKAGGATTTTKRKRSAAINTSSAAKQIKSSGTIFA